MASCRSHVFPNPAEFLLAILRDQVKPRIRIMYCSCFSCDVLKTKPSSIYSRVTVRPHKVTENLMREIFAHHHIWPEFIHALVLSGKVPQLSEEGSSRASVRKSDRGCRTCSNMTWRYIILNEDADSNPEISYQFQYVEDNGRPIASRWSLRHTGIYHQQDKSAGFDLWIILHPVHRSLLEQTLMALADDGAVACSMCSKLYDDPFRLHLLIYSSILG